jgi:hypothetical protein
MMLTTPVTQVSDTQEMHWCSKDVVKWTQVTASAAWAPRLWFSAVIQRDRMWVHGGWPNEHRNFGDVWYSKDRRYVVLPYESPRVLKS